MRKILLDETGIRYFYLIIQVIILFICGFYISFIYQNNIYPDKVAKDNFIQTDCIITHKQLSKKGRLIPRYRASFLIEYTVGTTTLSRWVSGNGLDIGFSTNQPAEEDLLAQYDLGGSYPCWYNPVAPEVAILVMRHSWTSTLPLLIPSVGGMITLYYFLQNIAILMGNVKNKVKEKRKDKNKRK